MDAIYQKGRASVADVLAALPDPPSYSTARALIGILETKGRLRHVQEGAKYVYLPTRPRDAAGQSALDRVIDVFFEGSLEKAVAAHLADPREKTSKEELKRIANLIEQARKRGL
jgi:predicted transcriptional regulator